MKGWRWEGRKGWREWRIKKGGREIRKRHREGGGSV